MTTIKKQLVCKFCNATSLLTTEETKKESNLLLCPACGRNLLKEPLDAGKL